MTSNEKKYFINPDIFFLFEDDKFYLWNYKDHEQFEIKSDIVSLLSQISKNQDIQSNVPHLHDLIDNNIVGLAPFDNRVKKWGWDKLSYIYHTGIENIPELQYKRTKEDMIRDFLGFSDGYAQKRKEESDNADEAVVKLSSVDDTIEVKSFIETLKKRLTSRHFSGEKILEKELSAILYYSFGEIHDNWDGLADGVSLVGVHKTSPSHGGIHSVSAYVVIENVENIKPGVYNYDARNHALKLIHEEVTSKKLIHIMADQFYMEGLAFGVFLVSDLEKVWAKYLHSRAYREIALDAGHLSQTFQLMASSLNLNTWISGYFRDNELKSFLNITDENKAPLVYIGVGHGERTPLHPEIHKALNKE